MRQLFPPLLVFRQKLSPYGGMFVILVLYACLVFAYNYTIPFSKGPDEYINYQYIHFIAQNGRLPKTIAERQEAGVKADWQPLYHLAGGVAAAPNLELTPTLKVTWEPATRQLIDLVLPRATLIRTEDERWPQYGAYAIWQRGRYVSMLLGGGTLIMSYLTCLLLWPGNWRIATGITSLLVFTPRFLFTHAVLSDDTMLGFCMALYFLCLTQLVLQVKKTGETHLPNVWLILGLGVTAGLSIVTKYSTVPAAAGGALTLIFLAYYYRWSYFVALRSVALFSGALMVAMGWWVAWVWYYFNQVQSLGWVMGLIRPLLPGTTTDDNPTTARLTAFLSGQSVAALGEAPGAGGNFFDWAVSTFNTFWGIIVFGAEPAWPYPYTILLGMVAIICGLAFVGLGRAYFLADKSKRLLGHLFLLHILLFFPIPLLRFALSGRLNDAAQGRHLLFPAGLAVMILLIVGWQAWLRPAWRNNTALLAGGLMLFWGGAHLAYLHTAYPAPLPVRTTPEPQLLPQMQLAQHTFGEILRLDGFQAQQTRSNAILQVDLLWHSLDQAWEDYHTELTLLDSEGHLKRRWLSHPIQGRFPTRAWQPDDTVLDTVHVPLGGLAAGDYTLHLQLLGWNEPLKTNNETRILLTNLAIKEPPSSVAPMLWQQGHVVQHANYRYRATIPVSSDSASIALLGPNQQVFQPLDESSSLKLFMVEHNWPSGEYNLQVDNEIDPSVVLYIDNFDTRRDGWSFTPPELTNLTQANFANKIKLLGYDLPLRRVKPGDAIPLVLYWQALTQMREDYTLFVQLVDANFERRGGYDRFPRETYNTYLWVPGEVVDDGFAVPVDADAPSGVYQIRLGFYEQQADEIKTLSLVENGQQLAETSVTLGPIKVGGPPASLTSDIPAMENLIDATFGEDINLQSYDLRLENDSLNLKLIWTSLGQPTADYTVFLHLRDQPGQTVAQVDRPPASGQYPTSLWDVDEKIADEFFLDVTTVSPGTYDLVLGLYDPKTGVRLNVPDTINNSLFITEVVVE